MGDFDVLDSITLFHEMCHLKSTIGQYLDTIYSDCLFLFNLSIAIPGSPVEAIGWEDTIDLPADEALLEADSFGEFGTLILCHLNES